MKRFYKILLSIGIAFGVFCAITVFSAGQRVWTAIVLQNQAAQSDIYKIVRSPDHTAAYGMGLDYAGQIQSMLPEKLCTDVKAPGWGAAVSDQGEPLPVQALIGTKSNYLVLHEMQLLQGRYISEEDLKEYRKVCVLRSSLYDLLGKEPAASIEINGASYEIIGVVSGNDGGSVYEKEGDVFVPVTTLYRDIEKTDEQSGLITQIDFNKEEYSAKEIVQLLTEKAAGMAVDVSELKVLPAQKELLDDTGDFIKVFLFILILSMLVLLIAAFNIIHIATASIMDREREIGLRMALGANTRDIGILITKEILVCTMSGGLLGVAIAATVNTVVNRYFNQFILSFNLTTVFAGIVLAFITGWITSILPAVKAAGLDPMAALREE